MIHKQVQLNGQIVLFLTIQFNASHLLIHSLNVKQFYFTPIDRTLSDATTWDQSGPGSNGNKGVLHIPQISKTGASQLNDLMSFPERSLVVGSLTPMQNAVGVFYSPSRLSWENSWIHTFSKGITYMQIQTTSLRNWTLIAESTSYDDNR